MVMKRELRLLKPDDYIETLKDLRFPKKDELRVFGKSYSNEYVYIKIRVSLLKSGSGQNYIFIMSFHYSEYGFKEADFPYKTS